VSLNNQENSLIQFSIDRAPADFKLQVQSVLFARLITIGPGHKNFARYGAKKRPRGRLASHVTGAAGRHAERGPGMDWKKVVAVREWAWIAFIDAKCRNAVPRRASPMAY
jgi:hypothetical protein